MHNYKRNDSIIHNGRKYNYDVYCDRLDASYPEEPEVFEPPDVLCPHCLNDSFKITYGNYQCIAVCSCGHRMRIYEG